MNHYYFFIFFALYSGATLAAECPQEDATHRYVTNILQNVDGHPDGSIRIYYELLRPFDPGKETLLVINGGPGGDHHIVEEFAAFTDDLNVISFDHRGLGCTQITSPYDGQYIPGLYSMEMASSDIEAIRADLLGDDRAWFIYGVSYGSMLAQKYSAKYEDKVKALVLDSAMHQAAATDIARRQYVNLFIESDSEIRRLYHTIVLRFPEARFELLRKIAPLTRKYKSRTQDIKTLFETILAEANSDLARKLFASPIYAGPVSGMHWGLMCEEIWDSPSPSEYDQYYGAQYAVQCPRYQQFRNPADFRQVLSHLQTKTFIMGGAFDPVTPIQAMREMSGLLSHSMLYENPYAGHWIYREKADCAAKLMRLFFDGASFPEMAVIAGNAACQAAPE